jgi:broad specificity phosphatase PhoE
MESLIRQVERKAERENKPVKVLIVSHGLTIRFRLPASSLFSWR